MLPPSLGQSSFKMDQGKVEIVPWFDKSNCSFWKSWMCVIQVKEKRDYGGALVHVIDDLHICKGTINAK